MKSRSIVRLMLLTACVWLGVTLIDTLPGCASKQDAADAKDRIGNVQLAAKESGERIVAALDRIEAMKEDPDADQDAIASAEKAALKIKELTEAADVGLGLASRFISEDGEIDEVAVNELAALVATVAPASIVPWLPIAAVAVTGIGGIIEREQKRRKAMRLADEAEEGQAALDEALTSLVEALDSAKSKKDESGVKLRDGFAANSERINSKLSSNARAEIDARRFAVIEE